MTGEPGDGLIPYFWLLFQSHSSQGFPHTPHSTQEQPDTLVDRRSHPPRHSHSKRYLRGLFTRALFSIRTGNHHPSVSEGSVPGKSEKVKVKVAQLCLTLCNPMDCSPPASSVHGILQARMLEWIAVPISRGSSQSRN